MLVISVVVYMFLPPGKSTAALYTRRWGIDDYFGCLMIQLRASYYRTTKANEKSSRYYLIGEKSMHHYTVNIQGAISN